MWRQKHPICRERKPSFCFTTTRVFLFDQQTRISNNMLNSLKRASLADKCHSWHRQQRLLGAQQMKDQRTFWTRTRIATIKIWWETCHSIISHAQLSGFLDISYFSTVKNTWKQRCCAIEKHHCQYWIMPYLRY